MGSGTFYPAVSGDDGFSASGVFEYADNKLIFGNGYGCTYGNWVRFPNVTIPSGSTITEAYVVFVAYAGDSGATCNVNAYFNNVDDAVAPTNESEFNALALTGAVAWGAIGTWVNGTQYNTPELKTILQDIVDRGGWTSGNALQFVTKDNTSSADAKRRASAINYLSGAEKAELHVTWEEPEVVEVILPGPFSSVGSISIGGLFNGSSWILGKSALFTLKTSLESNIQIELSPFVFTAQGTIHGFSTFLIAVEPFIVTGKIHTTLPNLFSTAGANRVYLFTLTGEADSIDDIVIPISSFQSRIKSGDPTYLSVVIPSTEYATDINLRLNGDLIVRMGYKSGEEILLTEIISRVTFENIIINEGSINKSITLDGHKTETWVVKEVDLKDPSYKNLTKGKLRYRCKPDLYLKPDDTANINGDTFVVNSIVYSVSSELETYEVAE